MARRMLHGGGGTFWTRHLVVMAWFPRELTDVVVCCTQPKRVSKIGTKRALHRTWYKWHPTWIACTVTGRCCTWEHVGSHWRKPCYNQIRGRNHKLLCRWSLRKRWNRNGTTCPSHTRKGFPSWFRRLEWCAFHRTTNSSDEGSSIMTKHWGQSRKGDWRIEGDPCRKEHKKKISTVLLQCTQGTETF